MKWNMWNLWILWHNIFITYQQGFKEHKVWLLWTLDNVFCLGAKTFSYQNILSDFFFVCT